MTTRKMRASLLCGAAAVAFCANSIAQPLIILPVAGFLLYACAQTSGQTAAQITQTVLTDAADVANGLATFATDATSLPNATAIAGFAQDAITLANSLNTSMTQTVAQPILSQIGSDVQAVANAVQGLSLSTQASTVLNDVVLALQILLPLVGLLAPTVTTAAMAAAKGDPSVSMGNLHSLPTVTIGGKSAVNR